MKEYKMAIVGFGGMANWHRELLTGTASWNRSKVGKIDRLSILGTFDICEARQQAARKLGLKAYESFEAVLSDPQVCNAERCSQECRYPGA
jgi:scyllo-inositol 2-dehydrogenase (NADP+)